MQRMENFCRFEVSRTEMWLLGRTIFDTINTLEASEIANSGWRSTKWPPKMTWYHKIVYISKTVPPNRMQFAPNDPTSFLHQNTAAPWTDVIKADKKNKLCKKSTRLSFGIRVILKSLFLESRERLRRRPNLTRWQPHGHSRSLFPPFRLQIEENRDLVSNCYHCILQVHGAGPARFSPAVRGRHRRAGASPKWIGKQTVAEISQLHQNLTTST